MTLGSPSDKYAHRHRSVSAAHLCLRRTGRNIGVVGRRLGGRAAYGDDMRSPHVFLTEDDFTRLMALQPHPLLRAELERAIVLTPDAMPAGVVTMNSRVR